MTSPVNTTFTTGTTITSNWLNGANDHVNDLEPNAHTASNITNVPSGQITASNVQDAINQLGTYNEGGTGAVDRTLESKLQESISVKDFGASPSASASVNDAAIAAAVAYCNTLTKPKLLIPEGAYTISNTAEFDLPNYSTIEFIGSFITASDTVAVRIGSTTENRFGYYITGLKVNRSTIDTAGSTYGVQLRNIAFSYVDIRQVTNFHWGVHCYADQSNGGVSYNEIHFGQLHDNRINLWLSADGASGGYTNENLFFGGSFNHSSGYPSVSTINIFVDYDGVYSNNNNRFFSPSLEGNSTLDIAAVINGENNIIFHPRLERSVSPSTFLIEFTADSSECQIIGGGFGLQNTNIQDLGSTNSYETRNGWTYKAQTAASTGQSVISCQSTADSNAKVLTARNASGTDTAWITGTGTVHSATNVYAETGIRYATNDLSYTDRGLFIGAGSPEGVLTAAVGSLYVNTSGGTSTTLYVKTSGSGNTGWTAK